MENISHVGAFLLVEPMRAEALLANRVLDTSSDPRQRIEANMVGSGVGVTQQRPYLLNDGIAILPVKGIMTKDWSWWGDVCMKRFIAIANVAGEDPDVKGVLCVVDSPGGEAAGCQEMHDCIRALAKLKPVHVFYEDCGASAAYYAFCGATKLLSNATGWVGCLGTVSSITDYSAAFEQNGLKKYVFKTGPLKGAGTFGSKITDEQAAEFQRIVDQYGEWFLQAVMLGRGMRRAKAQGLFTGGMFTAQQAIKSGLIDGVGTLDAAVSDLLAFCDGCPPGTYPLTDPDADPEGEAEDALIAPAANIDPTRVTTQISPSGGSTGPVGAGKTTLLNSGEGARKPMSSEVNGTLWDKLVRALSRKGLTALANKIIDAQPNDNTELGDVVARGIDDTVAERVALNPMIMKLETNGIASVGDLDKVLANAALGVEYVNSLRDEATAEAIRAFGPDDGAKAAVQLQHSGVVAIKALRDSWGATANAMHRIKGGNTGEGATRQTASTAVPTAGDPPATNPEAKSNWEKLTEAQKAYGLKNYKTDAEREVFATNLVDKMGVN